MRSESSQVLPPKLAYTSQAGYRELKAVLRVPSIHERIVNEVFDTIGEIAKKSDFISAGLKDQDVYAFCKQGYLERVKKGYYKLAVGDEPKEELILSKLMTHGVICVESALFYYGYSDFAPREFLLNRIISYERAACLLHQIMGREKFERGK